MGFFGELHPDLVVSSTAPGNSVTTAVASSSYTLTLITIIAGVMLPVVLLYTAWNYWVFRRRVTARTHPVDPADDPDDGVDDPVTAARVRPFDPRLLRRAAAARRLFAVDVAAGVTGPCCCWPRWRPSPPSSPG